jgi:hypothetical protein
MSNNEQSSALLGDSEASEVQDSVGETIPALPQLPEEGSKISSPVGSEDTWHVLPDEPFRLKITHNSDILEGQLAAWVISTSSLVCSVNGE